MSFPAIEANPLSAGWKRHVPGFDHRRYIQSESPGKDRESNWLPAPNDKFVLMMRLYWPKEAPPSILDGSWKIPPVRTVQ